MSEPLSRFSDQPLPEGARVALGVSYAGSDFCGWQRQSHSEKPSVQGELETALGQVAAAPITVHCAGRTDAGVHASHQVVHFDSPAERSPKAWVMGCNSQLPDSVAVKWAHAAGADFHARFSALYRSYRYVIQIAPARPALTRDRALWVREQLDTQRMHEAAQALLGEQDFSAFRAAGCQSTTPMRRMDAITVSRRDDLVCIDVTANAFLLHMVRNIVGSLVEVGAGRRESDWLGELLASGDRTRAAATAQPQGLYLTDVGYPEQFRLPGGSPQPLLWV